MAKKGFPSAWILEHPSLFGLESECQVTFFSRDGDTLPREMCTGEMVHDAGRRTVNLPGRDEYDLFLSNGGRFYRDSGFGLCNLEYATPECTTPDDLIAHIRAGDAIIADALGDYVATHDHVQSAIVSKCNFDYHGHTSGSHENHLHTQSPSLLAPQLIPLLATRGIVSGGGGFDDASPGIDFMVSPRVRHLEYVVSHGAQDSRAIYTIKKESLAGPGYHRLQLLSSESVRCEASERLRFAPVALVVRMAAAGRRPGDAMHLADPLHAINVFARDPTGRATVPLASGRRVTALDVQRHYLDEVESCLSEPWMPAWSETECARWRWVLDALTDDPQRLIGHLDWPTKQHMYRAYCEQHAIPWDTLPRWGRALREVFAGPVAKCDDDFGTPQPTPRIEHLLKQRSGNRARIAAALERHGLNAGDLPQFVALRNTLFETEIRFGEIGPDSLFANLEREGLITPGTVSKQTVDNARDEPPSGTRAALRGIWIQRSHAKRSEHSCNWDWIRGLSSGSWIDLSDPFCSSNAVPSISGANQTGQTEFHFSGKRARMAEPFVTQRSND